MSHQTQVVVVGAGYAGLMAAMRLARKTDARVTVTLINATNAFHERVRNHQLAAGQTIRRRAVTPFLRGTRIQFLQGTVTGIRPSEREIMVQTEGGIRSVGYDYLMYALGSFVGTAGVPGVGEHAYALDHASALALAGRLPEVAAQGGRVLVVGGGNTGVEIATELAETYPSLRLTLATRRSFAPQLSAAARAHIRKAFSRLSVQFRERTAVTRLYDHGALTEHGDVIPFDACVWVGGFAVPDLARRAGLRVNARGQILIDRAMRSLSHPEIYAVGDAADPVEEPGAPIRMALYTALAMGAHGADCLAAQLAGASPTAFGLSYGALGLSLGRRDGVVQFLDGSRDTPRNLIVPGKLATLTRELFVRLALLAIRAQRVAPWAFFWPGKNKMRGVAVGVPRPSVPVVGRAESAGRADSTPRAGAAVAGKAMT